MSGHSSNEVLSRLMHLEEGIQKHSSDPTFPDISRIGDIVAEHTLLGDALTKAHATAGIAKQAAQAARAELTHADVLAQKVSYSVLSWIGTRDELLRDFGMKPHKLPKKRGARTGATSRDKGRGGAHAAAGSGTGGSGGASAPAPTPSPTEGSASGGK